MEKPNILNDNSTTINLHTDPVKAVERLTEEVKELRAEKRQLQVDKQMLLENINFYKEKVQMLELSKGANRSSAVGSGPVSATEIEKLKRELAEAHKELGVLKTDIENFKSWTKKLDWSTTSRPSWLTKYFKLEDKHDVKGTFTDGATNTMSGETVDGIWHGMCQIVNDTDKSVFKVNKVNGSEHGVRKITDKGQWPGEVEDIWWMGKNLYKIIKHHPDESVSYLCADEQNNGVSVGVMEKPNQIGKGYSLKNGYCIAMHNYKEELCVNKYSDSTVISTKWYQLKK